MNNIKTISKIKREDLDECNYFKTLIEEAYNKQMISDNDIVNLQVQLVQLLDERIYRCIGDNSSSIRKEILNDISDSNLYTIGLRLKYFKNPDDAIKYIKEEKIKLVYQEGRKKIDRMINIIRLMYIKLKQNMINVGNEIYEDTILGGIQGFLKIYDPDFKAQDIKITADYQIYNNLIGKLTGIEFIKEYVYSIYLENIFCKKFLEERIKYLLYSYSPNYKKLIINIFEIVFLEVIGCKLVKKNIEDLAISKTELNEIYLIFKDKNNYEIKDIIYEIYKEICNELIPNNIELQEYMEKNLNYIIEIIINAVEQNTLEKIFITQKFIEK